MTHVGNLEPVYEETSNQFGIWIDLLKKYNDGINPLSEYWEWVVSDKRSFYRIPQGKCEELANMLHNIASMMPVDHVAFTFGPQNYTLSWSQNLRHAYEHGSDVTVFWFERKR